MREIILKYFNLKKIKFKEKGTMVFGLVQKGEYLIEIETPNFCNGTFSYQLIGDSGDIELLMRFKNDSLFNSINSHVKLNEFISINIFHELIGNNCAQTMIPLYTEELFIKLNDDFISIQYMVGIGPHTVVNEFELFYAFLKSISNWKS